MSNVDAKLYGMNLFGQVDKPAAPGPLVERFTVPPFSVLDTRAGYWQDRKRAWLGLGIKSELGRGGGFDGTGNSVKEAASPCGRPFPAMKLVNGKTIRGTGNGRPLNV